MLNIGLQYLILTKKMNQVFSGGVLWTFIQKAIYFYLTRFRGFQTFYCE